MAFAGYSYASSECLSAFDTSTPGGCTASPFRVKNTFIDVGLDASFGYTPARRRCHSAPPAPQDSDASTDADSSCDDASSLGEDLQRGVSFGAVSEVVDASSQRSASVVAPSTLASRTKLSSGARLWAPVLLAAPAPLIAAPLAAPPLAALAAQALPQHVRLSFAVVVADVLRQVRRANGVERAEIAEGPEGWTVYATVQQQNVGQASRCLVGAKQAVQEAAEKSAGVCLIGCEASPFVPLLRGFGFSAQLAAMPDKANACWDLVGRGCCYRGQACRWRHPSWQTSITIQMAMEAQTQLA